MMAVGRAAFAMIEEVRRQFKSIPGLMEEKQSLIMEKCVDISTSAALREMMLPGLLAAFTPVAVGFLGGTEMLAGLLTGVTASGVVLAIYVNSGGAWDNAKKMVEEGASGRDPSLTKQRWWVILSGIPLKTQPALTQYSD